MFCKNKGFLEFLPCLYLHLLTWHSAFIEQHKLSLLRRRLIAGKLQVGAFNFVAGYTATATQRGATNEPDQSF